MEQFFKIYENREILNLPGRQLQDYQKMVRNYMNINTVHESLFIWHSTGRGKTMSAISLSEPYSKLLQESPQLDGYIYIIGSHASIENFINELIGPAGNVINNLLPTENNVYITNEEREELEAIQFKLASDPTQSFLFNQTYKKYVLSRLHIARYRFYTYQKFINLNITNIDNSIIIVDEAHNLLNMNEYSQMLKTLVEASHSFKVVLLTATPMFNSPYDIVDFLNLMFKKKDELDFKMVFSSARTDPKVELDNKGLDYLNEHMRGKISYLTAKADVNFPIKIEMGTRPPFLKETKLIRVPMSSLQMKAYEAEWNGSMTQNMKYIINAVFPGRGDTPSTAVSFDKLEEIPKTYLDRAVLGKYAPKYLQCLENLDENHKVGKSMVYHSYVNQSGILMFADILRNNGYMDYSDNYVRSDARDRLTGKTFDEFKKGNKSSGMFSGPVKFAVIHGDVPLNERQAILEVYNSDGNLYGEKISILIGSQLLRESVDIKAGLFLHILNYQENYSRLEQIEGRFIRYHSHDRLPKELHWVKIYKYVSSIPSGYSKTSNKEWKDIEGANLREEPSAEEWEYIKDERNYIKMKEITASLKLVAVDCQQNLKYNAKGEDLKSYRCQTNVYRDFGFTPTESYQLFYSESEIHDATLMILDLMTRVVGISHENLLSTLPFDEDIVNAALNTIIQDEVRIPGKYAKVVRIGDNILYHSLTFDKIDIDINYRRIADSIAESTPITDYLTQLALQSEKKYKLDVSRVYAEIKENPQFVEAYLSKYDKSDQAVILESAIRDYIRAKKDISEVVYLILKTYKRYLIDENEMSKDINNTPFDKYFDSISWNKKDDGKLFIGHFLNATIRVYDQKEDKFIDVLADYMKKHKERDLSDNPFGIGSLARDLAGNIVFKIRDPIRDKKISDLRKLPRGYVCNRVNNKKDLYKLLNNLEVPYNPMTRISDLCLVIEKELRERQKENNKKGKEVLWFEDIKL